MKNLIKKCKYQFNWLKLTQIINENKNGHILTFLDNMQISAFYVLQYMTDFVPIHHN